ncbi:MAG TPA: hypothetical protein VGR34_06460 [Candidatus Dormibacteraeota bacterium]|nr:hypothetical protein [Candidatus Dormibacteraeota bacterium]
MIATPEILSRLARLFAKWQKKRAGGCVGDPSRFDKFFPVGIQAAAVRRAEAKRARKAHSLNHSVESYVGRIFRA